MRTDASAVEAVEERNKVGRASSGRLRLGASICELKTHLLLLTAACCAGVACVAYVVCVERVAYVARVACVACVCCTCELTLTFTLFLGGGCCASCMSCCICFLHVVLHMLHMWRMLHVVLHMLHILCILQVVPQVHRQGLGDRVSERDTSSTPLLLKLFVPRVLIFWDLLLFLFFWGT